MKLAMGLFAIMLAMVAPAAAARVQYDTTQLDQRADVERNRILLNSTMRTKQRWDAGRARPERTRAKAAACAGRARFRREYGADNPKLQRLERLCKQAGY